MSFKWNVSGGIRIVSFNSASRNITSITFWIQFLYENSFHFLFRKLKAMFKTFGKGVVLIYSKENTNKFERKLRFMYKKKEKQE